VTTTCAHIQTSQHRWRIDPKMADFTHSVLRQRVPMQVYTRTVAYITEVYTPGAICLPLTVWSIFVQFYTAIKLWEEVIFGKLVHYSHSRSFKVIKTETYRTRSPAGAGIANRPLVFLGFFFNFRQQHSNMVRREQA